MASPLFYEALHSKRTAGASFPTGDRPVPDGWRREDQDDWLVFVPPDPDIPMQGWKIHVSAGMDNAERILDTVWEYCVPRCIEFKFLRSMPALWLRSSKYAPRGYSGKLVTIYPPDDAACETVLRELGGLLDGEPGPYILSDLRWGNGPLYVRYGGFTGRYCVSDGGQVVLAIADDTGKLVPDRRDPVFYVPPWVTLPDFLAPDLAARNAVTVSGLPYTIDEVMHFSNGGGCYRGRDTRTDDEIVLKEARPFAGLDSNGADAVRRLEREHEMLQSLAGVPGIPKVYDHFALGEHRFMAMEYVEGRPLHRALVRRYPMIDVSAGPEEFADYTQWALDVYQQVETALHAMHERGVVYGDLHLFNIMIRPDDAIALLDFEVASRVEDNVRPGLGNQGFAAPPGTTGVEVDRYALACLRLALFLPMTQILWLARAKVTHFAEVIAEHFPVPAEFLAKAIDVIAPPQAPVQVPWPRLAPDALAPDTLAADAGEWPAARDRLTRAILASASPDREDRLFPGDIEQFRIGGLGLAYGAAGVLHALAVTGAPRHPELEEWLIRRSRKPVHGTMLGLYDGLHGVAFTLDHLGHRQEALDLLEMCLTDEWETLGLDLMSGLSGIGLNLAHFADRTGDPALRHAALRTADLVGTRLGEETSVSEISGRENPLAGLFHGSSGPALLLLRAYDDTGDTGYLDRAAVALRQDLRRCIVRDNGAMEVNEGWRTMPYLAVGSVGVGFALDGYLARRHDEQFAQASRSIRKAAQARMYVQSGLFAGRAGILLYLAGRAPAPRADDAVAAQVRALAWHALPYADGLAFPGDQLLRLSMDVATGTAGVLLAVGAALHDQPVHLPLLAPTRAPRPQVPAPQGRGLVSTNL
jgi:serine/threonine protein kinase